MTNVRVRGPLRDQYLLGRELSRLCRPPGYPVRTWSKFTLESDLAVGAREPGCQLLGNNARSGEEGLARACPATPSASQPRPSPASALAGAPTLALGARLTQQRPQVLQAGQHVLLGVQHLLGGLPHIPVAPAGEHQAAGNPGSAGRAGGAYAARSPHRVQAGARCAGHSLSTAGPPPLPPQLWLQEGGAGRERGKAGQEGGIYAERTAPPSGRCRPALRRGSRARGPDPPRGDAPGPPSGRRKSQRSLLPNTHTHTLYYKSRDAPRQSCPIRRACLRHAVSHWADLSTSWAHTRRGRKGSREM